MTSAAQCTLAGAPPVQALIEAARHPDALADGYSVKLLTQAGYWAGEMRYLLDRAASSRAATVTRKGH
jgi:hypothetical protein